jgi:aspartyl-tRNA(Asn)/glutamyl-tRNA(Gln) amidotransferase subunit A
MSALLDLSAVEMAARVRAGKLKAEELTKACLDRIAQTSRKQPSFFWGEESLARAREIDKQVQAGRDPGPLAGVPVALKDNLLYEGHRVGCASKILEGYRAPYNATVVERMLGAGAVLIGRTNMDEFAMGSSTENSAYGPTRNPWDAERVPGGSSGGSAAAVAARMVPLSLGSDTGGSIRQPAALCGIAGLKPTYGLVSRWGLVAFASSLDQIGPFARTTEDAALLLSVLAGWDRKDSTSAKVEARDYVADCKGDLNGLRIGLPKEAFVDGLDPEVAEAVRASVKAYEKLGAKFVDVSLPNTRYGVATYYIIAPSEASANLARFDGVRFGARKEGADLLASYESTRGAGFGPEVKRRIMLGTYALSSGYYDAYYGQAQRVRTLVSRDYAAAFEQADLLLTPTAPTPAFKLGEKADDPLQMYLNDVFTIPANLAGLPGLSVPCGFSKSGLPIGLQLQAPAFQEARLLRAAARYEEAAGWSSRAPASV